MSRDLIPGELHGRRNISIKSQVDLDAELIAEVQAMNGDEFKAKYIKSPDAAKNMAEYQAALQRKK